MEVQNNMKGILNAFENLVSKPDHYISSEEYLTRDIRKLLKSSYDFAKKGENNSKSNSLPELIIENFDLEQIWQQIELQNDFILKRNVNIVSKLGKDNLLFEDKNEQIEKSDSEENGVEDVSEQSDCDAEIDDSDKKSEDVQSSEQSAKKIKPSIVDDTFFKLDEMNNFLLSEEKKIEGGKKKTVDDDSESENSIDMFRSGSEEDSGDDDPDSYNNKKNPRYKDFFGKAQQSIYHNSYEDEQDYLTDGNEKDDKEESCESNKFTQSISQKDNDKSKNFKSPLELREERLNEKIKELENAAITEKPWQLKGEIMAGHRPINSLLEEVLEYDVGSRPAPVITEATTLLLEDAIKQRIKDKSFDDVERKERPVDTPLEYKKKLVLDQEKSKQSLAQIYENEYMQQQNASQDTEEKEEEDPALHKEIRSMMTSLFTKLDALSNFHFTPKPVAPELKVVNNLPAINIEEVAPISMTNASLLAPEEVKPKGKGDVIGKSERTTTDKNRERRKKKNKQREHGKQKMKNSFMRNPGLGNKYSKEKAKIMLDQVSKETNVDKMDESLGSKQIKSSTAFFTQLQEQVSEQIKRKTIVHKKIKKAHNAKKLKL